MKMIFVVFSAEQDGKRHAVADTIQTGENLLTFVARYDADGSRPYLLRNSDDYTPQQWAQMLEYLKINAAARLLKFEIIEEGALCGF